MRLFKRKPKLTPASQLAPRDELVRAMQRYIYALHGTGGHARDARWVMSPAWLEVIDDLAGAPVVAIDPSDWIAGCDETEDHHLAFTLRHRFDNLAAIMAFGEKRCSVTDPGGVTTTATGTALVYQYLPYHFAGAPPVRSGTYHFAWEGRDQKGNWRGIVSGSHEVKIPPLLVRLKEPPRWDNWQYVALIAAFNVEIINTTDWPIKVGGIAFTTDNRGLAGNLTSEQEHDLARERDTREERDHYGPPLRLRAEIRAHESVSGWRVTTVARDPAGGTPWCRIIMKDNVGNEYWAEIERQDPQKAPQLAQWPDRPVGADTAAMGAADGSELPVAVPRRPRRSVFPPAGV